MKLAIPILALPFLFFWILLLSFIGHYLVRDYISGHGILHHCKCFFFSFLCLMAFTFFFIFVPAEFMFAEFVYLSLLVAISVADMCTLFIPTILTIGFIPAGFVCASTGYLPISLTHSIIAALFGYGILWVFAQLYIKKAGTPGIGEGDFDMLALIGAFTGFYGVWAALTIGSATGSLLGIIHHYNKKTSILTPFPFGPLLAFGSYCYLLYSFTVSG